MEKNIKINMNFVNKCEVELKIKKQERWLETIEKSLRTCMIMTKKSLIELLCTKNPSGQTIKEVIVETKDKIKKLNIELKELNKLISN